MPYEIFVHLGGERKWWYATSVMFSVIFELKNQFAKHMILGLYFPSGKVMVECIIGTFPVKFFNNPSSSDQIISLGDRQEKGCMVKCLHKSICRHNHRMDFLEVVNHMTILQIPNFIIDSGLQVDEQRSCICPFVPAP